MAGPSLGTLLIQRLDAALGIGLSQQGQIVQRAGAPAVYQPGDTQAPHGDTDTQLRQPPNALEQASTKRGTVRPASTPETPAVPAREAPTTRSANITLGQTAKIILQIMSRQNAPAPPLQPQSRLLASRPGVARSVAHPLLVQQLARGLAQNVQQSGLFYESHLKSMVQGQYRVADLRQEPQARLPAPGAAARGAPAASPTPNTPAGPPAAQPSAEAAAGPGSAQPGSATPGPHQASLPPASPPLAQGASPSQALPAGPSAAGSTAGPSAPLHAEAPAQAASPAPPTGTPAPLPAPTASATPGIDPAAHTLVHQQLESLADQAVRWAGEAWPGTQMEWMLQRDPPYVMADHRSVPEEEHKKAWRSQLRIHLPQLGTITAVLQLDAQEFQLSLHAGEETTSLLQHHSSQLLARLTSLDTPLTAFSIQAEAPPEHDNAP